MKYILIPVNNPNSSDDFAAFGLALALNFISALVFTIYLLPYVSKYIPSLHGWLKLGVCILFIIILTALSIMPYIGFILSLLSVIFWIMCILSLTKGISASGLKWTFRVIGILLILLFESPVFLSHIK